MTSGIDVRPLEPRDRPFLRTLLAERWGSQIMVRNRELFRPVEQDGFLASIDGEPTGALTYLRHGETLEIAWLDAGVEGRGVGSALVDRALSHARARGCRRVVVTTTNA